MISTALLEWVTAQADDMQVARLTGVESYRVRPATDRRYLRPTGGPTEHTDQGHADVVGAA